MEKVIGYVLVITALTAVTVTSFWPQAVSAKSTVLACVDLQKQALGSGGELQKKADDICKIADAQKKRYAPPSNKV